MLPFVKPVRNEGVSPPRPPRRSGKGLEEPRPPPLPPPPPSYSATAHVFRSVTAISTPPPYRAAHHGETFPRIWRTVKHAEHGIFGEVAGETGRFWFEGRHI